MPYKNKKDAITHSRIWKQNNRDKVRQNDKKERKKNRKSISLYGGVCTCPICTSKGYKYFRGAIRHGRAVFYTLVRHSFTKGKKTIIEKECYVGCGKL
jgi:hypothetical protein